MKTEQTVPVRFIGFDAEFAIKEILELSMHSLDYRDNAENHLTKNPKASVEETGGDTDVEIESGPDPGVAQASREVFHQYFRPRFEHRWPGSERVHHISPVMVRHRPHFLKFLPMVQRLVDEADCLVGFAVENDIEALRYEGVKRLDDKPVIDIRDLHWLCHGKDAGVALDARRGLSVTAEELGIDFSETAAHGASYDTRKTMECLSRLLDEFVEKYPEEETRENENADAAGEAREGMPPGILAHYLRVWDRERELYYREYAKGWIAVVESGDGYRLKTSRVSEPTGEKVIASVRVNARYRALDEIDARFDRRRHNMNRNIYRLTKADIEWFKAYTNEYDGQEPLHKKMQELRSRSSM